MGDTPSLLYMMDGDPSKNPIIGQITVENTWNRQNETDYQVGSQWWTDSYAPEDYWHNCAGARYQLIPREEIMADWGQRWSWLK